MKPTTSFISTLLIFLRLGLTSFGGPVAHLAFFRHEFVERRRWLSDQQYADLVALCQFLPGPASSQVGLALGWSRGGYSGALAAWLGFTLPSALLLVLLALGLTQGSDWLPHDLLQGLKVAAVAVVAYAVWSMARSFCTDWLRRSMMLVAALSLILLPGMAVQLLVLLLGGLIGLYFLSPTAAPPAITNPPATTFATPASSTLTGQISYRPLLWLVLFGLLLFGLPWLATTTEQPLLQLADAFYRAGALVFGGGHVVLPLLQTEVVQTGWVSEADFMAGYGAAQVVPGPLFTFAAFLGALSAPVASPWIGGLLALLAVFAPGVLLVFGILPYWERLRQQQRLQAALVGVNAAVVGLLLAALYNPVFTTGIKSLADTLLALLTLFALWRLQWPVWLLVPGCALLRWLAGGLGLA